MLDAHQLSTIHYLLSTLSKSGWKNFMSRKRAVAIQSRKSKIRKSVMRTTRTQPFEGLEEAVTENEPLAPYTWYKIGGPARYFVRPRSLEELQETARRCAENRIPNYVLGLGANLLVGDQGVDGAVFRLDQEYWRRVKYDKTTCEVGAGVDMQKLVLRTCRQGLAGIECLAGIPGTIGGGIRMNAGGKFGDI